MGILGTEVSIAGVAIMLVIFLAMASTIRVIEWFVREYFERDAKNKADSFNNFIRETAAMEDENKQLRLENDTLKNRVDFLMDTLMGSSRIEEAQNTIEHALDKDESRFVLVTIGESPLDIEATVFREVKQKTGLDYRVLKNPNFQRFAQYMDNHRARMDTPLYLHFATHGCDEGIKFSDGYVGPEKLSRYIDGVEVLFLNSCKSEMVGYYLGIAKFIITMGDNVRNDEAVIFAREFWERIGNGIDPQTAYEDARLRSPVELREMVELHY